MVSIYLQNTNIVYFKIKKSKNKRIFAKKINMYNRNKIRNERQWSALIGVSSKKFDTLVKLFQLTYEKVEGVSIQQAAINLKKTFLLQTYEECVFFVLYQLKNSLTYDVLGFHIGAEGPTAHRLFKKYLALLEHTLFENGYLPKRNLENADDLKTLLGEEEEIIIDVTEIPIQRNHKQVIQKEDFSGKKKAY